MAVLVLRFSARAFSSCGKRGPLFIAVRGPLTIAASLVLEHRLQTRRLSNCVSRAQLLCGMWDLPRPELEPVYPALAGRFSTTAPPGKPNISTFYVNKIHKYVCWFITDISVINILWIFPIWLNLSFEYYEVIRNDQMIFVFNSTSSCERTLDHNSNSHEEIKNTSKVNYRTRQQLKMIMQYDQVGFILGCKASSYNEN